MGIRIGPLHVRRSIFINAAPARVWQEFDSFERISGWLGRGHTLHVLDPRPGGNVDLSVEIDGKRRHFGGAVLIWESEHEVTFESNWAPPHAWPVPTLWTIRLTPTYDGTLVELFHHGFERFGADAADELESYESGWDVKHLAALRSVVER
jgi:uncharacterized protein YndB with AHSA1/START domain